MGRTKNKGSKASQERSESVLANMGGEDSAVEKGEGGVKRRKKDESDSPSRDASKEKEEETPTADASKDEVEDKEAKPAEAAQKNKMESGKEEEEGDKSVNGASKDDKATKGDETVPAEAAKKEKEENNKEKEEDKKGEEEGNKKGKEEAEKEKGEEASNSVKKEWFKPNTQEEGVTHFKDIGNATASMNALKAKEIVTLAEALECVHEITKVIANKEHTTSDEIQFLSDIRRTTKHEKEATFNTLIEMCNDRTTKIGATFIMLESACGALSGLADSSNAIEIARQFEERVLPHVRGLCFTMGAIVKFAFDGNGVHIYALKTALNEASRLIAMAYGTTLKLITLWSSENSESYAGSTMASILMPHITMMTMMITHEKDEQRSERLITIKCIYEALTTIYQDKKVNQRVSDKILSVVGVISTAKSLEPGGTEGNEFMKGWPVLANGELIMKQEPISKYSAPNKTEFKWIPAVDLQCHRAKTLIVINSSKAPQVKQERKEQHRLRSGGGHRISDRSSDRSSDHSSDRNNNQEFTWGWNNQAPIDYEDRRTDDEKREDERQDQQDREEEAKDRATQARYRSEEKIASRRRAEGRGGGGGSNHNSKRNAGHGGGGGSSHNSNRHASRGGGGVAPK
jgi:hypothetical protein